MRLGKVVTSEGPIASTRVGHNHSRQQRPRSKARSGEWHVALVWDEGVTIAEERLVFCDAPEGT